MRGFATLPEARLRQLADVKPIDRQKASAAIAMMDRVFAMTWKLIGS